MQQKQKAKRVNKCKIGTLILKSSDIHVIHELVTMHYEKFYMNYIKIFNHKKITRQLSPGNVHYNPICILPYKKLRNFPTPLQILNFFSPALTERGIFSFNVRNLSFVIQKFYYSIRYFIQFLNAILKQCFLQSSIC